VLVAAVGLLPFSIGVRIAQAFALTSYHVCWKQRKRVLGNLHRCFPASSESWRITTARRSFAHWVVAGYEIAYFSRHVAAIQSHVVHIDRFQRPKGLMLSGHYGNYWLLAMAIARSASPLAVVAKPPRQPFSASGLIRIYLREVALPNLGVHVIDSTRNARAEVEAWLDRGGSVLIYGDLPLSRRVADCTLLGYPHRVPIGPARIAWSTSHLLIPITMRRRDARTHLITTDEGISSGCSRASDNAQVIEDGRRMMIQWLEHVEAAIRNAPEQWLWSHRCWD
jgi:KDO2-lipid IV(A) lauroyltransferase